MLYALIGIAMVSLALGVLAGMLVVAKKPCRRRDHFRQAAEAEVYGDVPLLTHRNWSGES